jgi:hypothetical protein
VAGDNRLSCALQVDLGSILGPGMDCSLPSLNLRLLKFHGHLGSANGDVSDQAVTIRSTWNFFTAKMPSTMKTAMTPS